MKTESEIRIIYKSGHVEAISFSCFDDSLNSLTLGGHFNSITDALKKGEGFYRAGRICIRLSEITSIHISQ